MNTAINFVLTHRAFFDVVAKVSALITYSAAVWVFGYITGWRDQTGRLPIQMPPAQTKDSFSQEV